MSTDWNTDVLPVLEAVHQAIRDGKGRFGLGVEQTAVNSILGREEHDEHTAAALDYLSHAGYLDEPIGRPDNYFGPAFVKLTEKALQRVAGWPAGSGDAMLATLLAELDRRIATAGPDERSALERFRDFAGGVGREVLVAVLSAYADRAVRGASS